MDNDERDVYQQVIEQFPQVLRMNPLSELRYIIQCSFQAGYTAGIAAALQRIAKKLEE